VIHAIVLAGGAGTRFWPASRKDRPKQLLSLAGSTSLLQQTIARLAPRIPARNVHVATGAHLLYSTAAAIPDVPLENILAEPAPRNTAPCIAWATSRIARIDPDAVVCVFPSDHFIRDEAAFHGVLDAAIRGAEENRIVMIGIVPTRPETGYGYVERGTDLGGGLFAVERFVEKPDLRTAEKYLETKRFLWNAGMFFFRARVMQDAVKKHLPELATGLEHIAANAALLGEIFPTFPNISIDYGIMEKVSGMAVVPGDFGWNDLGSWQSAWELAPKDAQENSLPDGAIAIESKGNLVVHQSGQPKTWALAYVEDLVIVETADAVLVIPRSRAQDVRQIIEELKKRGDKLL
jgi:mannose-1-phosphate guanylyltransferase